MRRIALVAMMAVFAATSFGVTSFVVGSTPAYAAKKKKDAPGKCGTLNYYDKKKKKCVSAVK
ncbi:MAG TPA: hypothetical protein VNK52_07720 [Hyphomicrobiaceae bacterium]|nr:hypothetical protein [Hyphomicrobiaceae bacterium]